MGSVVFKVVREPSVVPTNGEGFTLGRLYVDNKFVCFTCEDRDRKLEEGGSKVYAQTAIPRGRYKVVVTHSNRFKKPLPLLLDVPQFKGIRIHGGNRAENSEGCILVGQVRTKDGVAKCAPMVDRVIAIIEEAEDLGKDVFIEVE